MVFAVGPLGGSGLSCATRIIVLSATKFCDGIGEKGWFLFSRIYSRKVLVCDDIKDIYICIVLSWCLPESLLKDRKRTGRNILLSTTAPTFDVVEIACWKNFVFAVSQKSNKKLRQQNLMVCSRSSSPILRRTHTQNITRWYNNY